MKPRNSNMELPYVHQKHDNKLHASHADSSLFIVVRLSDLRVMKILAQALVLALLIMILPGLGPGLTESLPLNELSQQEDAVNLKSLPLVLQDLADQGLLTTNDIMSLNNDKTKANIVISPRDTEQQHSVPDESFGFSFTNCFAQARDSLDRTLKVDGIVVVQLGQDPSSSFNAPSNYKMVYFRKLNHVAFVAMRKMYHVMSKPTSLVTTTKSPTQRKLLEFLSEEKKAVLGNLEDVLLEPPRSATGKSKTYLRKTKFLPDLLNDSLEGYSRRVYIDVGGGHGSTRWFEQNYPTRNKDFDIYKIETVPETEVDEIDDAWEGPPTQMGISDWLWRNVKEKEYVVMRADAEVVEEMLKSKAIVLVDELFMECKPWGKGGKSKRAYWECLALYGRLRDLGVAVHQWWG